MIPLYHSASVILDSEIYSYIGAGPPSTESAIFHHHVTTVAKNRSFLNNSGSPVLRFARWLLLFEKNNRPEFHPQGEVKKKQTTKINEQYFKRCWFYTFRLKIYRQLEECRMRPALSFKAIERYSDKCVLTV